jgi:pyridoxal phosphate enzyme (YggS family)
MSIENDLKRITGELLAGVTLVAVSKTKPVAIIQEAYDAGHRVFGENKVQELVEKQEALPKDIQWHMIGHLQSNKVKYIAPFVSLIHGIDSLKLLTVVNKEGLKNNRKIPCLLQVHIAQEETKFGFDAQEIQQLIDEDVFSNLYHVEIHGLMGMASYTPDQEQVRKEFRSLRQLFEKLKSSYFSSVPEFRTLSMGMSGDYDLAMKEGSNMVRIGSAIFGSRG